MKYIAQITRLIPLLLLFLAFRSSAAEFTSVGKPTGWNDAYAFGVSADGSVVAGYGYNGSYYEPFRWTSSGGFTLLGRPTVGWSSLETKGVSADGSTIIGYGDNGSANEAFRWTSALGNVGLGMPLNWTRTQAYGVNADGSVVVGYGVNSSSKNEVFRWTSADGIVGLGIPAGWTQNQAYGVNADGSVVVGNSYNYMTSVREAFRWTSAGGFVDLGKPAGWSSSYASGVSADGNVVIGYGNSGGATDSFRWAANTFTVLTRPAGWTYAMANAVSADGSTVVGLGYDAGWNMVAFRWKDNTMQSISDWLVSNGGSAMTGWDSTEATAVNADGTIVVGYGNHTVSGVSAYEAWLARGAALVSLNDLSSSLCMASSVPQMVMVMPDSITHGLHHRPLQLQGELEKQAWATGDFGRHNSRDATMALGEMGGSFSLFKGQLDVGLGIGTGAVWQDLPFGGGSDLDGKHVYLELGHRATGSPFVTTVSGTWGGYDAVVRRGYEVSGSRDASTGRPDVTAGSLRLRFDWLDAWKAGGFTFTPKAEYTAARSTVSAYTETGGGFPASFNEQDHVSHETRLGFTAERALTERLQLRGLMEWVHRYDAKTATVSGEVTGLFPFSMDGAQVKSDWLRAGLELERKLGARSSAVVSFHATTPGEDPTYWMNVGLQWKF